MLMRSGTCKVDDNTLGINPNSWEHTYICSIRKGDYGL